MCFSVHELPLPNNRLTPCQKSIIMGVPCNNGCFVIIFGDWARLGCEIFSVSDVFEIGGFFGQPVLSTVLAVRDTDQQHSKPVHLYIQAAKEYIE